jgi:hypothetical protein
LEERVASNIRAANIGELGTTLAVIINRRMLQRNYYTANVVPNLPIPAALMMEEIGSSEISLLTRATRLNIPEDGILHSHRPESLRSYIALRGWAL